MRLSIPLVIRAYRRNPAGLLLHYLADEEIRTFFGFRFAQKRFSWLAGRVAAKQVLRCLPPGERARQRDLVLRRIGVDPLRGKPCIGRQEGTRGMDFDLSISHCATWAACAASRAGRIGIDLEELEPLSPVWLRTVYTLEERAQLADIFCGLPEMVRSRLLWVLKESFLKALGVGFACGLDSLRLIGSSEQGLVFALSDRLPACDAVEMVYGMVGTGIYAVSLVADQAIEGSAS